MNQKRVLGLLFFALWLPLSASAVDLYEVDGKNVNIRSAPSLNAKIITQLQRGTALKVITEAEDWYQIALPDGQTGYIYNDLVSVRDSEADKIGEEEFADDREVAEISAEEMEAEEQAAAKEEAAAPLPSPTPAGSASVVVPTPPPPSVPAPPLPPGETQTALESAVPPPAPAPELSPAPAEKAAAEEKKSATPSPAPEIKTGEAPTPAASAATAPAEKGAAPAGEEKKTETPPPAAEETKPPSPPPSTAAPSEQAIAPTVEEKKPETAVTPGEEKKAETPPPAGAEETKEPPAAAPGEPKQQPPPPPPALTEESYWNETDTAPWVSLTLEPGINYVTGQANDTYKDRNLSIAGKASAFFLPWVGLEFGYEYSRIRPGINSQGLLGGLRWRISATRWLHIEPNACAGYYIFGPHRSFGWQGGAGLFFGKEGLNFSPFVGPFFKIGRVYNEHSPDPTLITFGLAISLSSFSESL